MPRGRNPNRASAKSSLEVFLGGPHRSGAWPRTGRNDWKRENCQSSNFDSRAKCRHYGPARTGTKLAKKSYKKDGVEKKESAKKEGLS